MTQDLEGKHCGKLVEHNPHLWWGHERHGPKTAYWCRAGRRVLEGGFFGLRPRGTLTVKPPDES
jgi:hypothetical protein